MGDGQPAWVAAPVNTFAALAAHHGVLCTLVGAAVLAFTAVGIFLPPRWAKVALVTALTASTFIWVVGEAFGCLFGGQATDPNTGPLLILIACAYWPPAPGRPIRESVLPAARAAHLDVDVCNAVMVLAMAAMLIPGLGMLASGPAATVWTVVFATAAAWFTVRIFRDHSPRPNTGHHLAHLVLSCAMVYMILASSGPPQAMTGMTGTTTSPAQFPALALLLGIFALGYAVLSTDRLGRPAVAGTSLTRTAVTGTVMALAMGYMLILMLA